MLIKILLVCCFFNLVVASELTLCEYGSVVEVCKNKQITKVEIPKEVTYIADFAFSGCKRLSVLSFSWLQIAKNKLLLEACLFYLRTTTCTTIFNTFVFVFM